MITKEQAVQLVEALLVKERKAQPGLPELGVLDVEEHAVGWLVFWQSAEYLRSRELGTMLVGHGPYLVDREDGSVHHVPVMTYLGENWEQLYLEQVKGLAPPDPLLSAVREVVLREGALPALRHLRKQAPQLSLKDAKAYVDAVRNGGEPAEELTCRAHGQSGRVRHSFETLAGPALEAPPA